MTIKPKILRVLKKNVLRNNHLNQFVLNYYYKSIFYRKKHLGRNQFDWIKSIEIQRINVNEGLLKYNDLQFYLPSNEFNSVPKSQKYLYAALISKYNIPKHYLLFWDDLVIFHEVFIENLYDKVFKIEEGDVIIDIGSSIGWYTCKVSKLVGGSGKVIAIEPIPKNYEYLQKNLHLNKLSNVQSLNIGIWNVEKKIEFTNEKYVSNINKNAKNHNKIRVKVNSLDNIIKKLKLEKIDYIKMDIEGAEIEALDGAKELLLNSKNLKLMIAAYHKMPSGEQTYKKILPDLEKLNFNIYKKFLPFIFAQK